MLPRFSRFARRLALGFTLMAGVVAGITARSYAAPTTLFADEFNAGLSSSWAVYGTDRYLSRTQMGNKPVFGVEGTTKYMRLRLDTYNAQYPGSYLTGTEVHTKTQFTPGNGVEIEARIRAPGLPPGVVWAFFMLGERGVWPDTYARDEIDFENLSSLGNNQLWTNIFNDTNPNTGTGRDSAMISSVSGRNPNNWGIYKIKWFPDRVEWWFNAGTGGSDILVRTETDPLLVCDDTQSIRFNIWASDSSWTSAYGDLPVTNDKTQNTSYFFDIDYVHMTSIGTRGIVGTGTGLKAEYFDNPDFTSPLPIRVDPKINFDWGGNAPLAGMGSDTFSVRWTGQVQPSFTETYTFYVTADDGVRLWVNNKLLIDHWSYSPSEYSGTIALVAGKKYAIKMEYFDDTYGAKAQLRWSSPSTSKGIVPKSQLYSLYVPPKDTIAPVVKIDSPLNTYSYASLWQATGTATDNVGVTYATGRLYRYSDNTYWTGYTWGPYATEYVVKDANWKNWTLAFPAMSDGKYSVRASAKDAAGKVGVSSVVIFYIDTIAPTIKITVPAANGVYPSGFAKASGTASDAVGVANVRCVLQRNSDGFFWSGSSWTNSWTENLATGTTAWTYALPPLSSGYYSFWAVSRDWIGHYTYSPSTAFRVQ
jgi:hypothetical protein